MPIWLLLPLLWLLRPSLRLLMPFMWLLRPSMAAAAILTIAASCSLVVVVISLLDDVDVLSLLSLALALALALGLLVAILPIGFARLLMAVVGPADEVISRLRSLAPPSSRLCHSHGCFSSTDGGHSTCSRLGCSSLDGARWLHAMIVLIITAPPRQRLLAPLL